MNAQELRTESRRSAQTRRVADRRQVPYEFGSAEWLENVKNAYVAWPKSERRDQNRRAEDRRLSDRRMAQASEQARSAQKYSRLLLTTDERRLIESLYLTEAD